jgi:hypothetical protein
MRGRLRDSLWIAWTFTFYFNWVAFLWIGLRARNARWQLWALLYFLPFLATTVLIENDALWNDWPGDVVVAALLILGITSIIHALRVRTTYIERRRSLAATGESVPASDARGSAVGDPVQVGGRARLPFPPPGGWSAAEGAERSLPDVTGRPSAKVPRPGRRVSRRRKVLALVLLVAGLLWTLLWALVWFVAWVFGGSTGLLWFAFEWRVVAPTVLGLLAIAVAVGLLRPGRLLAWSPLRLGVVSVLSLLAAVAAVEWFADYWGEGPYPFGKVADGELIAYSTTEGIRLIRADGGRSWLLPGTDDMSGPVWSPDGERLALVDLWDCCKVYAYAKDGSKRTRLPADSPTTPVWSPDGGRLLVVGESDAPRIRVRRLGDGSEVQLRLAGNEPVWSPDGRLIAFQSSQRAERLRVFVAEAGGGGLVAITPDGGETGSGEPAWSPDGKTIAFSSDLAGGDDDIYTIRADGTGLRRLTTGAADDSHPSWSPDGRRLVFARSVDSFDRTAIVVYNLTTGVETEIVSAADRDGNGDLVSEPVWQPA